MTPKTIKLIEKAMNLCKPSKDKTKIIKKLYKLSQTNQSRDAIR